MVTGQRLGAGDQGVDRRDGIGRTADVRRAGINDSDVAGRQGDLSIADGDRCE